jgi:methyl-accepting chemotaxis protein
MRSSVLRRSPAAPTTSPAVSTTGERRPLARVAVPSARRPVDKDDGLETAARQAGVLSQASLEVAETSRQAAESLTELRSAIGDISASTTRASAVAEEAVRDAETVDARISALQSSSEAINDIVRLITTISQQSKILALNAFVEAARAGDVGRGFAVVADEVKALADRTARAAGDISAQIGAVQEETRQAITAVHRISATLGSIAEAQEAIAVAVDQQRVATDRVVDHVDRAAGESARITEAVGELADNQRRIYVRQALDVARDLLAEAGGAELGTRQVTLSTRNQADTSTVITPQAIPELLLGGVALDVVSDPRRFAPLVDDVVQRIGGSCTLFQRLDAAGSMVRIATTVVTSTGQRNVGSYIARFDPDGQENKVLAKVLSGQTYTGAATVAGRPYFTAYTGVHSSGGDLIGMLYVGLPLDAMAA